MQKQYIFLIGPMGCGKTAVGEALAVYLARPFVDTDVLISLHAGMPIAEIFAQQGEDAFRTMETTTLGEVIQKAGHHQAPVVATGGGIVICEKNREMMKQAGWIISLKVDQAKRLERIGNGAGRPLVSDQDRKAMMQTIQDLDTTRTPWYHALADIEISNDAPLQDTVRNITQAMDKDA